MSIGQTPVASCVSYTKEERREVSFCVRLLDTAGSGKVDKGFLVKKGNEKEREMKGSGEKMTQKQSQELCGGVGKGLALKG